MARDRPLLLWGPMGAGKSTLGRELGRTLGLPFEDLDDLVEARAGKPIARIFAEDGETSFRSLERAVLTDALEDASVRVLALGGGALLDRDLRLRALARTVVVGLRASLDTLELRSHDKARPLLDGVDRRTRLLELLEQRASAYAEVHATVATDAGSIQTSCARIAEVWEEAGVAFALEDRSYGARIVRGRPEVLARAVEDLQPTSVVLVTDENVEPLWAPTIRDALRARGVALVGEIVVEGLERAKQMSSVERGLDALLASGADRGTCLLGLGGGVVTDLTGFLASIYLRGVRWVAAPTTLLAMVDASLGGKTGVDVGLAKNAAGAFHQPSAVVMDVACLTTEPERSFRSGLAEVVKSLALGDALGFEALERATEAVARRELHVLVPTIRDAAGVKASIVNLDERELGPRAFLNLGHTFGHALESFGGFERWTHGESVAVGLAVILRVGEALGVTPRDLTERVVALLERLGLPTAVPKETLLGALPFLGLDKKRRGGLARAILLEKLGLPRVFEVPSDELKRLFIETTSR